MHRGAKVFKDYGFEHAVSYDANRNPVQIDEAGHASVMGICEKQRRR